MAKSKGTLFFCSECGYESSKWLGKCPACGAWNSFVEEPERRVRFAASRASADSAPVPVNDIQTAREERVPTGFSELDRVLGGGIVAGSIVLVGGDPGIGKSTLLLQVCKNLTDSGKKTLYISGEESYRQIKLRADRLGVFSNLLSLLCETDLDTIEDTVGKYRPDAVVIDSVQTMYRESIGAAPGSVSQVREAAGSLMRLAKDLSVPVFLVGHVTKEGVVAGPKMLEHMVDTVLYFEGERDAAYRVIRSVKNRFGAANEIGVFEMSATGLKQVLNPSEYMLKGRPENASGSVVTCLIEGTRPVLAEIQALVTHSSFGMPRRTAAGIDYNRVNLLMAVLEKRLGVHLGDCDAYVNAAGGMKVAEPAIDLPIVLSILSSYNNAPVSADTIAFGEVGLSGEIRAVSMTEQRVSEAKKLGFKRLVVPAASADIIRKTGGIEVCAVANVQEAAEFAR